MRSRVSVLGKKIKDIGVEIDGRQDDRPVDVNILVVQE